MALSPSTRLGPYEILEPAGAGGMGEVYRARDTRLDRTVAIKVLPSHVSARDDLRQRFEREARAIAALNHPHICALYDVGPEYLVMEYLEGETLESRLQRGPLPVAQALEYAIQIAGALDQAHRHGVIHRDLKPANVMLTRTGAKLLDFGLAKLEQASAPVEGGTRTISLTTAGTVLGTFQYMAPEQLEGKDADARTDIFALGAVIYEMVTGRRAFEGQSQASLITAIMSAQPAPISSVQPMIPPALDHVVRTCFAKEPEARWQTAHDVLVQLKWIAEAGSQAGVPKPVVALRRTREYVSWALAAVLAIALAALTLVHFRERPAEAYPVRFLIPPPEKSMLQPYDFPVISPDGRRLVVPGATTDGKRMLWLRSMDSLATNPMPGTDGAFVPFWSPDSRFVGFVADGKLKKIDASGGPPQTVCDASTGFGSWNAEGIILFSLKGRLHRVAAGGGELRPALELDKSRQEIGQWAPHFLPDGKHFIYQSRSSDPGKSGIYLGSLNGKETKPLILSESNAAYVPPGFLVFARQQTLLAQPFDAGRLQLAGDPFPITDQVARFNPASLAAFSTSGTGVLVYRTGGSPDVRLAWYDRSGKRLGPAGEPGPYRQIVLSPDDKRLAVERIDPKTNTADLWLLELSSGIFSRLTFHPANEQDAVWSPDGRQLVFSSNRKGVADLYRQTVGAADEALLLESQEAKYAEEWLKDSVLFINTRGQTLYQVPLEGERKPVPLIQSEFEADEHTVSPDGRWIAYSTNESGRWEIYLASFPRFTDRRQVSNSGGVQPAWRKDGRELVYMTLDGAVMSVDIRGGAAVEAGPPKVLFQTPLRPDPIRDQYSMTSDGRRFLIMEPLEETSRPSHVVLNWTAGLKR